MKKIMFNDKFGLTQAVLEGKKTMTRRICKMTLHRKMKDGIMEEIEPDDMFVNNDGVAFFQLGRNVYRVPKENQPTYKIGEEVAVAQSYKAIGFTFISPPDAQWGCTYEMPGYSNKMFVRADFMPHRIRITDIKVERLQDISEEDAMREGIRQSVVEYGDKKIVQWTYFGEKITTWFDSPREAFAALIDRISGRGTWQRNPWVFAYEFELLR